MHCISACADSHIMDFQNPYMKRKEIHPARREQKTSNLLDLYPCLFNPLRANHQARSTIQHPTSSKIPPKKAGVFVVSFQFFLQPPRNCIVLQAFNPTLYQVTNGQWTQRTSQVAWGFRWQVPWALMFVRWPAERVHPPLGRYHPKL